MKYARILLLLLPLLAGCATMERLDSILPSPEKLDSTAMAPSDGSLLSREEAERIALEQTGLNRGQVSRMKTEYEYEDGQHLWEVEFRQGSREYQLRIDARTGQVLKWEVEAG